MSIKNSAIVGRTDLYNVNPNSIIVQEGFNPRTSFDENKLDDLKNSIIANGVKVPLLVKLNNENNFVLIDGERRLRATLKAISEGAEIVSVPCRIERKTMNEIDMLTLAMTANESERLTPIEEAHAFNRLKNYGISVTDIAKKVGKSVPFVYNRLSLLDASPEVLKEVESKRITLSDAQKIIEQSDSIQTQKEKLEEVKTIKANKKATKISVDTNYNKKEFVELCSEMVEWLVELNTENIMQVNELIEKARKMLDKEEI